MWVWVDRGVCRGVGTHIRISKGVQRNSIDEAFCTAIC